MCKPGVAAHILQSELHPKQTPHVCNDPLGSAVYIPSQLSRSLLIEPKDVFILGLRMLPLPPDVVRL